jgi:hypothetical protein
MRVLHTVVGACLAVQAGALAYAQVPAPAPDPARLLSAAREALGGEQKLSAVKTLIATGRTRQVRGNNLVPIEFEIDCELPDKYIRKDEIPAQETGITTVGFNGADLVQLPLAGPPPARAGVPAPTPDQVAAVARNRVNGVKQDFARLMLGLFATGFSSYPLSFSYAGQAEAPQGTADVVDAKGPGNFSARLFIDRQTHLPIMLSWTPPGPPQAKPAESRLYFADYRDAGGGVQFPFRIRRAVGGDTVEETTFDRFRINPRIDPKRFEVHK